MRILYITNSFPYPLTSGYLRHYHLIRGLSQQHSVTLMSLTNSTFLEEHLQALAPYTEQILTFPRIAREKAMKKARTFVGCEPAVRGMRAKIEELTRSKRFDVAVLSGKQTLPAVRPLRGVPVVADVCDAASVRIRGQLACADLRRTPGLFSSYLRMRRIEKHLMRRASYMVFASCRDRDSLSPDPGQNAAVVPNGVDLDYWRRVTQTREAKKIVFTGAMHYPPNADAAKYLIQHIMPRVRKEIPDAELTIVGRDPRPELLAAAAGQTGVFVTGFVEDVRPYLETATVFAAPLRFGAGVQNKVLEAMAMRVPVVASPVAADGLRTEDGWTPPIEVAEKEEPFAQAILRELNLAERDPQPSDLTREYVQTHFDWPEAVDKLERVLIRATTRSARTFEPNVPTLADLAEPVAASER